MTLNCNNINLKKGSSGAEVREIQSLLTQYGYYDGKIDGDYGDMTITAIKSFQKAIGLVVDGITGPITCKKLGSLNTISKELKNGSSGEYVIIVQNKLKQLGYYTATIDGAYGNKTITSVQNYQKNKGLTVDGIVGNITYSSLLKATKTSSGSTGTNTVSNGIYTSSPHYESSGCNKLGQCTGYWCACVSFSQLLRKWGITKYSQKTIAGYMGTTTAGTGHWGIETGIAHIAKLEGLNLKVEWKNFSDLGTTQKERFKKLGEIFSNPNKGVIVHDLYRNQFGHYETLKTINTNKGNVVILNSLGNKCNSPAYCGYLETRSYGTMASYLSGISQKSICIVTKV